VELAPATRRRRSCLSQAAAIQHRTTLWPSPDGYGLTTLPGSGSEGARTLGLSPATRQKNRTVRLQYGRSPPRKSQECLTRRVAMKFQPSDFVDAMITPELIRTALEPRSKHSSSTLRASTRFSVISGPVTLARRVCSSSVTSDVSHCLTWRTNDRVRERLARQS
jgi:hypothetical protein